MRNTTEGFIVNLFDCCKETDSGIKSINNSPLQLVIVWMLHRNLLADLNNFIVKRVSNQVFIDLDF